ncbi:MAG: ester cyclase [Actinomycetota bacterium]|nr:ester cyclase [Actinomycetota bacterium]
MAEARQVMNAVTEAIFARNLEAAAKLYAADAVAITPDAGELRGREQIIQYFKQFFDAFPDATDEVAYAYESGNTAIDEGYVFGTNTGPIPMPSGESIPATGKRVRVRECDVATVENGVITSHRFYFDQMELLGQLGLLPEMDS